MNIRSFLSEKIRLALIAVGAFSACEPQVRQSGKVAFGHYQVNGLMTGAKKLGIPPQQLANQVLTHLDLNGIASKIEIVHPGFINIFLDSIFLANQIDFTLRSDRLGVTQPSPKTIVVDYSGPNVAKEMHVGHLRSTIIGDATVRALEFLGHKVIRANHIGDWGTQFGMLIAYLEQQKEKNADVDLEDLEEFYCQAKKYYDENETFARQARNYVVKLQHGDPYCLEMWRKLVDVSMTKNQITYDRLNVTLSPDDVMGESLYNPMLPDIVADLKAKGLAVKNQGATVVFLSEYKNKKGKPMGVIIQKKDGGYLYTTTDIACANYRYKILKADRILYYIDSRQHQHLIQTWAIVRKAGYVPCSVSLEHHMFGIILDKNRKPFRTREGGTVKLSVLLDEAIERARRLVIKKKPNISPNELEALADAVGIGAIKYADLSKNRTTDYIFDWDNMLTFEGNTAPYIQYAYARIISILRKSNVKESLLINSPSILRTVHESQLAVKLLQFEETLEVIAREGTPHVMCSYLYDLASLFSSFYENYPIISSNAKKLFSTRLKLALLTAKTLKQGLDILGIKTLERM